MLKNMKKGLKNQRGFTLVELLAVIVILGIIAAIAVPSIGGLINKTKDDAKVAEAIQIISAAKLYVTTNPKATTLEHDDLKTYLDNVAEVDYKVSVAVADADAETGKFSYSISNHTGANIAAENASKTPDDDISATEEKLLQFTGAK